METSEKISVDTKNAPTLAGGQSTPDLAATPSRARKHRTVGNKVFDLLVYPLVAFGLVFGVSVWAGYRARFTEGEVHKWYKRLSDWIETLPTVRHLPSALRAEKAWSHALVAVSFATGTLLMAPVKWFEDSRDKLSKFFDRILGTTPTNPDDYRKEPRQGWTSVMGGRLLTFAVVLGVATVFGRQIDRASRALASSRAGVTNPGENIAAQKAAGAKWQRWFVSGFETIYTALCAALVYVISRTMAKVFNKREDAKIQAAESGNGTHSTLPVSEQTVLTPSPEKSDSKWSAQTETRKRPEPTVSHGAAVDTSRAPVGIAVS